jgi:hypothetical protein
VADKPSVGVRRFVASIVALAAATNVSLGRPVPAWAFATGPTCGERVITAPNGTGFKILFANNGAVQRYVVVAGADNTELVNDARISIEQTYGPAGVNAPPLKIVSFKPGSGGGMMVPDKAVDSCGRTLSFN